MGRFITGRDIGHYSDDVCNMCIKEIPTNTNRLLYRTTSGVKFVFCPKCLVQVQAQIQQILEKELSAHEQAQILQQFEDQS